MSSRHGSFIFVNSSDRQDLNSSNTDFNLFLSNYNYSRGAVALSVENVAFHHTQYIVRSGNNTLVWQENGVGTDITSTLTAGVYTADEIATEVQTQMNADTLNAYVYTVTYNDNTKKLEISTTIPDTFAITTNSTCLDILGFTGDETGFDSAKIAASPINLGGELFADLELRGFSNSNILSRAGPGSNSIFARIPLNVSYGGFVNYNPPNKNDFTTIDGEQLNSLYIRLLNPDGSKYEMPANFNISITFRIDSIGGEF